MSHKEQWESIYRAETPTQVSWYQAHPSMSLRLIASTRTEKRQRIVDVGGGASVLVDCLLEAGFSQLSVLDLSAAAIRQAQSRLGPRASQIQWYDADVTRIRFPHRFELWHDRAVFHFLTCAADRQRYVRVLRQTLLPDRQVIIATFALTGPEKCSGLDVMRYDALSICVQLGDEFELIEECADTHVT
ncbi:MAG: class I SAM-dependent methyltransferase, partial [Acidiferrobacterales bacterium]